jgi:hypothetical protein
VRFFISGDVCREEVIGDPVEIEQAPNEVFAVHRVHVGADPRGPLWAVSHVETGMRIAGGDSIDFAIRLAREAFARKTPEEIAKALRDGRKLLPAIKAKPIGPFVAVYLDAEGRAEKEKAT